jgi:hypothetical protein
MGRFSLQKQTATDSRESCRSWKTSVRNCKSDDRETAASVTRVRALHGWSARTERNRRTRRTDSLAASFRGDGAEIADERLAAVATLKRPFGGFGSGATRRTSGVAEDQPAIRRAKQRFWHDQAWTSSSKDAISSPRSSSSPCAGTSSTSCPRAISRALWPSGRSASITRPFFVGSPVRAGI